MFIPRDTMADQLAKVIQVLQLGRKTGMLTVERGEGITFEEGLLVFVNGQIVEAGVGKSSGQEALGWLNSWGKCRFAFVPKDDEHFAQLLHPFRSDTGPLPQTNKHEAMPVTRPLPVPQQLPNTGSQPIPTFWQAVFPKQTLPVEHALRLLERAGLSRAHKHVFLLIDGQRTVDELARITRRQASELSQLLDDLERIGVVQR